MIKGCSLEMVDMQIFFAKCKPCVRKLVLNTCIMCYLILCLISLSHKDTILSFCIGHFG